MELKYSKTLWGVSAALDPENWDKLFERIRFEGYSAIESIPIGWRVNRTLFKELLKKHHLVLIAQIHTTGGYILNGNYIYCLSTKVEDHVVSFRSEVLEALEMGAIIINSHSGHDSWGIEKAVEYFRQTIEIELQLLVGSYANVIIVHETHRQRLLYSPYQALEILSHHHIRNRLKINADLSHWVCVCEHLFDENDARDDWWPEVLQLLAEHCYFIHARFGHAEGPQIHDPRNEKWKNEINCHLRWWSSIWKEQKRKGVQVSYVEPEHGNKT